MRRYMCIEVIAVLFLLVPGCKNSKEHSINSLGNSVLRVTSTIQYPDPLRPWLKKQPFTRQGLATVISGGRLLVTADIAAHSTYIELEKPEDGPKGTAIVEALDEECNLAVLKPLDPQLLNNTRPLKLATDIHTGSKLDILQLESNGAPATCLGEVITVGVMPYPADSTAYLLYRAAASIPQREGSFVVPAISKGKLAGLVMRYDPRTQSADIIPAPLIARFLKESAKPGYTGLARAGLSWQQVRGTNLREWLGIGTNRLGVYVTSIDPEGPAEKGGLRKGDLIVSVADRAVDGEGNYEDPVHGKITFSNLANLECSPGESLKIGYFRTSGVGKGTFGSTTLTLSGRNLKTEMSPLHLDGERIPYMFLGGLLLQELSRPYLMEWGPDWRKEAPQNLVCLDAFQNEYPHERKHWVILSTVLPSPQSIGLQDLVNHVVENINGRPIHGLNDVSEAIRHPENGFQRIMLEGSSGPVFLNAETLSDEEDRARKQYGIPPTSLPSL